MKEKYGSITINVGENPNSKVNSYKSASKRDLIIRDKFLKNLKKK